MPGPPRPYATIAAPARREIRVLGSRFVAQAHAAADEAAARARRASLEREFPDATHHCWALRLRTPGGERGLTHDAGEPAGTAGAPILQALRGAGLFDVLVVVVRWFGGTKLGKGGLARAYREAARAALEAAGSIEVVPRVRLRLEGPLGADGEIRHAVARHGGRVLEAGYEAAGLARLDAEVPEAGLGALADEIARVTRGAWRIVPDTPAPGGAHRGG